MQFVLLASLWWLEDQEPQPPTQARLAEQAGTDSMMTSQVVRKLEGRALLKRVRHPTDSRALRLHLTSAGRDLIAGALADVEAADSDYFAPLGRRHETFLDALAALSVAAACGGEDKRRQT